ncbi:MAG: hypothetical protein L0215_08965 [Gemmataceae bacterium]|nr:hypothetical protein [Gemmataceae bacterium]
MKRQVLPNLTFGSEFICSLDDSGRIAVVHACKDPCHRSAVGYSERSLPSSHPHYLVFERGFHLFLNLIDPPAPLFKMASFEAFLRFVDKHIHDREVLVHCNLGQSRAPSLALLYMAKRARDLPAETYESAAKEFQERFSYSPGQGIESWLSQNWHAIQ